MSRETGELPPYMYPPRYLATAVARGLVRLSPRTLRLVQEDMDKANRKIAARENRRRTRRKHYLTKRKARRLYYHNVIAEREKARQAEYRDGLWGGYVRLRRDARVNGIEFALSYEEWEEMWEVLGMEYLRMRREGRVKIERVDKSKGYSVENLDVKLDGKSLYHNYIIS